MPAAPPISIIVPLFNREKFLPQLLATLHRQTFKDFEVLLIDDGSTDNSEQWLSDNVNEAELNFTYIKQQNGGPYSARNNGLKHAQGKYIALFDSDDEWPDYHLKTFYDIMQNNHDIDWLFGSIQRIDHDTRKEFEASNFYLTGEQAHPIVALNTQRRPTNTEDVFVIDDSKLAETAILHTFPGSMQCTMIKREVFDDYLFDDTFRTAYDRFYCMKAAMRDLTFAYVKRTHLIYHVHNDNISTVGETSPEKLLKSAQTMLKGYQGLDEWVSTASQTSALVKRISQVHAWELGIANQALGQHREAIRSYSTAIKLQPLNVLYVKSLFVAIVKWIVST